MATGVLGFPERAVLGHGVLAEHHAQPPAAQAQDAAGHPAVEIAHVVVLARIPAHILIDLARSHLPLALVHQHARVGEQTGGIDAGHRRAHQQGRPVLQGLGQIPQGRAATLGKINGAQIVAGSHAAEGQFRRDAQIRPFPRGLARGLQNALLIAGHVAGDAVALQ